MLSTRIKVSTKRKSISEISTEVSFNNWCGNFFPSASVQYRYIKERILVGNNRYAGCCYLKRVQSVQGKMRTTWNNASYDGTILVNAATWWENNVKEQLHSRVIALFDWLMGIDRLHLRLPVELHSLLMFFEIGTYKQREDLVFKIRWLQCKINEYVSLCNNNDILWKIMIGLDFSPLVEMI